MQCGQSQWVVAGTNLLFRVGHLFHVLCMKARVLPHWLLLMLVVSDQHGMFCRDYLAPLKIVSMFIILLICESLLGHV